MYFDRIFTIFLDYRYTVIWLRSGNFHCIFGILSWEYIRLIEFVFCQQLRVSSDFHTGKLHLFSCRSINQFDNSTECL